MGKGREQEEEFRIFSKSKNFVLKKIKQVGFKICLRGGSGMRPMLRRRIHEIGLLANGSNGGEENLGNFARLFLV